MFCSPPWAENHWRRRLPAAFGHGRPCPTEAPAERSGRPPGSILRRKFAGDPLSQTNREPLTAMPRPSHRFIALVSMLAAILVAMALLYMLGMEYLEGKPRTFWQSLQWAGGATSTTGFGVDTSWTHPVMVVFVVFAEFMGVALFFVVLPIYLLPFLEERFETKLPNESASARNHVVIFDYDATVATLLVEL